MTIGNIHHPFSSTCPLWRWQQAKKTSPLPNNVFQLLLRAVLRPAEICNPFSEFWVYPGVSSQLGALQYSQRKVVSGILIRCLKPPQLAPSGCPSSSLLSLRLNPATLQRKLYHLLKVSPSFVTWAPHHQNLILDHWDHFKTQVFCQLDHSQMCLVIKA